MLDRVFWIFEINVENPCFYDFESSSWRFMGFVRFCVHEGSHDGL